MIKDKTTIWQSNNTQQLVEALLAIDDAKNMQNFLRDVMTKKEIIEISARLEAARMLQAGRKYTEITTKTRLSSRTIARISDWIQNGCGGYAKALDKINSHHSHTPPDVLG